MNDTIVGFAADEWLGSTGVVLGDQGVVVPLQKTRIRGIFSLLSTPRWALHIQWGGEAKTQMELKRQLIEAQQLFNVVDLGPSALPDLPTPAGWTEVLRHTRQCSLEDEPKEVVPKTRWKQARRFAAEGGHVKICTDLQGWEDVALLHIESRERKGLDAHAGALTELLQRIGGKPWTFSVLSFNEKGKCLASGGFVMLENGTCVYSFGGQRRSEQSGRATVAMLLEAMQEAKQRGAKHFDFGGSQDGGVDQFYAEFGADVVAMRRWIHVPWWFRFIFPGKWKAWATPSRHF